MYIKYDKNGYVDVDSILSCGMPFIFVTGGRGTGKTYGALRYVIRSGRRVMWMRRTQNETDFINKSEFQPFKILNEDYNLNVQPHTVAKGSVAYIDDDTGDIVGYSCALSTIANMRGFDASDVSIIVYDEFIPERHKKPIKEEGQALFNAYETINRNRELQGRPPVQLLALSNSNRLDNEIFRSLDIINDLQNMKNSGECELVDPARGLAVFVLDDSPVSQKKKTTALYKLTAGSDFEKMALANDFSDLAEHTSVRRNLREYIPLVMVGEIAIYRHKSNHTYYITRKKGGAFKAVFADTDKEKRAFIRAYPYFYDYYLQRKLEFSDYASEVAFKRIY